MLATAIIELGGGGGGLMRGIKIPLEDFALKMYWGGGGVYLRDTAVNKIWHSNY